MPIGMTYFGNIAETLNKRFFDQQKPSGKQHYSQNTAASRSSACNVLKFGDREKKLALCLQARRAA